MNNYIDIEHMATDLKILIVQGQTLVDQTRAKAKEQGLSVDLTCRMQLKTDCREVETLIQKIQSGKAKPKLQDKLRTAIIRLQTTSDGILNHRQ